MRLTIDIPTDDYRPDEVRLLLVDALGEFARARTPHGPYVASRYRDHDRLFRAQKLVEVENRVTLARLLRMGVDDCYLSDELERESNANAHIGDADHFYRLADALRAIKSLSLAGAEPPAGRADPFTHVKVFSATKARERDELGAVITRWLSDHPGLRVTGREVRQSSDSEFHCLSITLFLIDL